MLLLNLNYELTPKSGFLPLRHEITIPHVRGTKISLLIFCLLWSFVFWWQFLYYPFSEYAQLSMTI